jgi:hypothetical protein
MAWSEEGVAGAVLPGETLSGESSSPRPYRAADPGRVGVAGYRSRGTP